MKTADLRAKSADELQQELMNLRKEQMNVRFQKSTGQLETVGRAREVRKNIAKIKTVQSEIKQGKLPVAKETVKKAAKASKVVKKKKESKE